MEQVCNRTFDQRLCDLKRSIEEMKTGILIAEARIEGLSRSRKDAAEGLENLESTQNALDWEIDRLFKEIERFRGGIRKA